MSSRVRSIPLLLAMLTLGACQTASLEGDWEGEIDCGDVDDGGGGTLDIEIEVEEADTYEYEGKAEITKLTLGGTATTIVMDMVFDQTRTYGGQVLDVEADCLAYPEGGDEYEIDCSDVTEMGWDGLDTMQAEIEDFLGADVDGDDEPDLDCLIDLER
jgi:hypothetical protein